MCKEVFVVHLQIQVQDQVRNSEMFILVVVSVTCSQNKQRKKGLDSPGSFTVFLHDLFWC